MGVMLDTLPVYIDALGISCLRVTAQGMNGVSYNELGMAGLDGWDMYGWT